MIGATKLHLVENTEDAVQFIHWLNKRRDVLAVDTETGGLEFYNKRLRLVQFGDLEDAWAVPFENWKGVVEEALNTYKGDLVFHNASFDVKFLNHHADVDMDWSRIHDTLLMSYLDDPSSKRHGLKHLGIKYVDRNAGIGDRLLKQAMAKQKWGWDDVPVDFQAYWAYGALDTTITAHLFEKYRKDCTGSGRYAKAYDLEVSARAVLTGMEYRGIEIDLEYCEDQYEKLSEFVGNTHKWITDNYGVSAGSNVKVAEALKSDGVTLTKRTDKGSISLTAEVLQEIAGHPLADAVLNYRKARKISNTYFSNFLKDHHNGRLYCNINSMGARTGRMTVRNPALQTLPRGPLVRNAFVPSAGNDMVAIDYQAVEMRLFAHFAKEKAMQAAIHRGEDLHSFTAQLAYDLGDEKPTPYQRGVAKNAGFAKVYGSGIETFALTADITQAEAKRFMDSYARKFPDVGTFIQQVSKTAKLRLSQEGEAYVLNPSGRRHPVEAYKQIYKLVNYLVQSEAAEVLKRALVTLSANGFDEHLLLPVHDEVIFEFPEDKSTEMMQEAEAMMSDLTTYDVPILAEAEGPFQRWGAKYEE